MEGEIRLDIPAEPSDEDIFKVKVSLLVSMGRSWVGDTLTHTSDSCEILQ